jgi:hypothetical protein
MLPPAEKLLSIGALRRGPPWWLHCLLFFSAALLLSLAAAFLQSISDGEGPAASHHLQRDARSLEGPI